MINPKVEAIFSFIDFLKKWQIDYIKMINPIAKELDELDDKSSKLNPQTNYKEKVAHDDLADEIDEVIVKLRREAVIPIQQKLGELRIWDGDKFYLSVYNGNIDGVIELRQNFDQDDVEVIQTHLKKYLEFREIAKTDFLGLHNAFDKLDSVLTPLIDYFLPDQKEEFQEIIGVTERSDTIDKSDFLDISNGGVGRINSTNTPENIESAPDLHQEIFKGEAFLVWESMWESFNIQESSRTDTRFMIDAMKKDGLIHKGVTYKRIRDWINETYQITMDRLPYKDFKADAKRKSIYQAAKARLPS